MITQKQINKIIKEFSDKTSCNCQYNNCPCNTCFHSIEDVDFTHICWLMLLAIRGDYLSDCEFNKIIKLIKEELNQNERGDD